MVHLKRLFTFGLLLSAVVGCDDDDPAGGGLVNMSLSNPMVFETLVRMEGVAGVEGFIDALDRTVVAVGGGAADGVVLTPISGGFQAVTDADFTGDGTREASFTARVTGDLATGASMVIDDVDNPFVASLDVNVSGVVTQTDPTTLSLDSLGGSVSMDETGPMNASQTTLTGGDMNIDRNTGTPDGSLDAEVTGENQTLDITFTYEPDGLGGWRVHITGSGLDFTIP